MYDDDSDDDVIGPVLPSGPTVEKSAVEEFREREERMRKSREVRLFCSNHLILLGLYCRLPRLEETGNE